MVDLISKLTKNAKLKKWFKNENNLIGFCSAISSCYSELEDISGQEFLEKIEVYEKAFDYFDVSKIKVRTYRRRSLNYYFKNFKNFKEYSETNLITEISQYL